jgi:hypothetical protein
MSSKQRTVEAVRDEIIAASAELRTVAQSEHDEARAHVADWLDGRFAGVTDEQDLHEASAEALTMYRGGMGSFQDVGSAASSHVVRGLRAALEHGRTLGAEPVTSEMPPAAGPGCAPTVQTVRDEIVAAIAKLRSVAMSEQDERRAEVADWLDGLFAGVTDEHALHEAAAESLTVYRGGMGSFGDTGTNASSHAVDELFVVLERGRTWAAERVTSEPAPAANPRTAPTGRTPHTVRATREEIVAAISEVGAAALLGQDEQRADAADWLDGLFAGVMNRRGLREASAQGLGLYRGGSGSFRDVGYAELDHAVRRLYVALRRGRSWFLRS